MMIKNFPKSAANEEQTVWTAIKKFFQSIFGKRQARINDEVIQNIYKMPYRYKYNYNSATKIKSIGYIYKYKYVPQ